MVDSISSVLRACDGRTVVRLGSTQVPTTRRIAHDTMCADHPQAHDNADGHRMKFISRAAPVGSGSSRRNRHIGAEADERSAARIGTLTSAGQTGAGLADQGTEHDARPGTAKTTRYVGCQHDTTPDHDVVPPLDRDRHDIGVDHELRFARHDPKYVAGVQLRRKALSMTPMTRRATS